MANPKLFTRSFNGGVISPEMHGRIDDAKYNTGLKTCNNYIVLPQGPIVARPGTAFVRAAKNADKKARMLPFRFSASQTMAIEAGEAYFRFHTFGATLLTPTTGLSAWTAFPTYTAGDLVTYGGSTYYAVTDVPVNKQPDLFLYGSGTPSLAATWVLSTAVDLTTAPPGYTNVGTELPTTATIGEMVYTSYVSYEISGYEEVPFGEGGINGVLTLPIMTLVTYYTGYTGTAVSSPTDFWYLMGEAYEIPSPYAELDLPGLRYVQNADVMTITHPNYAPRELRRLGATSWVLAPISFASALAAPTISAAATVAGTSPNLTYSYVVTRTTEDGRDESVPSAPDTCVNQLADTGSINTLTLSTTDRCNVYKLTGGIYGFIGQTTTGVMVDDNIAADISKTPPITNNPMATDWPTAVGYFEQRRVFAGTTLEPQALFTSKVGTEANLNYSLPPRPDDALTFRIAARESNIIRHIVPLSDLVVFTDAAEYRVASVDGGPLTPTTLSIRPQSYHGANNVQPIVTGNDVLYAASRGGHLRAMGYSNDAQSFVSVDMSLRALDLFEYKSITDLAFCKAPTPIAWAVSSDGRLLGMTYVPEQQVNAWHTHTTDDGYFESICVVAEGDDDILYAIVRRVIGEATVRYVERMATRYQESISTVFHVDCGVSYLGAAASTLSGLDHLEGKTVQILADGAVQPAVVVTGGTVSLPEDVTALQWIVGLAIICDAETLPLAAEGMPAYGQGSTKNVSKVWVRVVRSGAFMAGPDTGNLTEFRVRDAEPYGSPPSLYTGELELVIEGTWSQDGTICIRHVNPLPLTLTSLTYELVFGG